MLGFLGTVMILVILAELVILQNRLNFMQSYQTLHIIKQQEQIGNALFSHLWPPVRWKRALLTLFLLHLHPGDFWPFTTLTRTSPTQASDGNIEQTSSNQTLIKTSAFLSFVRMIYLPSSTTEVWGWASSAFHKRRKYALLGGKKKGVAEKWERLIEKKRQTGRESKRDG